MEFSISAHGVKAGDYSIIRTEHLCVHEQGRQLVDEYGIWVVGFRMVDGTRTNIHSGIKDEKGFLRASTDIRLSDKDLDIVVDYCLSVEVKLTVICCPLGYFKKIFRQKISRDTSLTPSFAGLDRTQKIAQNNGTLLDGSITV